MQFLICAILCLYLTSGPPCLLATRCRPVVSPAPPHATAPDDSSRGLDKRESFTEKDAKPGGAGFPSFSTSSNDLAA